jgi:hypothetical protein
MCFLLYTQSIFDEWKNSCDVEIVAFWNLIHPSDVPQ